MLIQHCAVVLMRHSVIDVDVIREELVQHLPVYCCNNEAKGCDHVAVGMHQQSMPGDHYLWKSYVMMRLPQLRYAQALW